jgi:hypothetical protein
VGYLGPGFGMYRSRNVKEKGKGMEVEKVQNMLGYPKNGDGYRPYARCDTC